MMIDWSNYKKLLREATLVAIQTKMSEVGDGSRVATIFYFIDDNYDSTFDILINVITNAENSEDVASYLQGIPDDPESNDELARHVTNTRIERIHKYLADGGNMTHEFRYPFDRALYDVAESEWDEILARRIRVSIEVQRELAIDPVLKSDEICDGCELTYMVFEGNVSLAGVVVKGQ